MAIQDKAIKDIIINELRANVNNGYGLDPTQSLELLKLVELMKLNKNLEKLISKTSKQEK
ncbi:hypothetical protein [Flavobacterium sp.]|uniref:hypothetical protein n=1 Tax=Flavobacterium sp. TaxID=239 RepID=UPI00286D7E26|nr:hypothetical protein [Flavobacterium sp.]